MAPTGVFSMFGLFYIFAGAFYGVPMGVQPMKAASAVMLIQPMRPAEVAGAGLVIGAVFLLLGLSGLATRLARIIPPIVPAGIQLGLGLSLAGLGLDLIQEQLWLGLLISSLTLILLGNRRFPAALVVVPIGIVVAQLTGTGAPFPTLALGLHLPQPIWPTWQDVLHGAQFAALPQIPLTLTNAIIVTAAVSHQLLPGSAGRVTERNLALTTGIGNLVAAPLGGYLMCHGAGGIAGHYRFGARTGTAPLIIGGSFLAMALLLGDSAFGLLALVPAAVLGSLLFFSGVELALASSPQRFANAELFAVLVVGAISVTANPAVAFILGWILAIGIQRGLVKL
jgi:SulP family sulfate permease